MDKHLKGGVLISLDDILVTDKLVKIDYIGR